MKSLYVQLLLIFLTLGCYKPSDKAGDLSLFDSTLELHFTHVLNRTEIRPDKLIELSDGRKFQFRYIRHIFTNIVLVDDMGDTAVPEISRVLIRENAHIYMLGKVALRPGKWKMYLLYGVDSTTNTTVQPFMFENANDPLAPQFPPMYWTWESGYLFTRVEALADTSRIPSGQINGFVDYHLGKTGFARPIGPFEVAIGDGKAFVRLRCNLQPAFAAITWPDEFSSHTFENISLAEKLISAIAGNIQND
ncbi:MAG: MbnP family protein [Thermaurantimonas sp.]